jgi:hypothetical protein
MSRQRSQARYKIDEIAAFVHPRDGHPKLFIMLEAYLDESGIHDGAPVCIVAGYFGDQSQMKKLGKGMEEDFAPIPFFNGRISCKRPN